MSTPAVTVLYDVPGPNAKRRYRLYALITVLALAAILAFVIVKFNDSGQFNAQKWKIFTYEQVRSSLFTGLKNTLKAFALGSVLALLFATVFASGRLSDHRILRYPSRLIIETFRLIPLVILIFLLYYGVTDAKEKLWSLAIGLMLYNGAVLAETFRAGVEAVPRGQSEAAYALGMRKGQVMRTVLLPQAIRTMLPSIVSQLVVLLKDTALGFLIVYDELLDQGKDLFSASEFERPVIPVTIVVAVIYIAMCSVLTLFAKYLQRRMSQSKKVIGVVEDEAVEVAA